MGSMTRPRITQSVHAALVGARSLVLVASVTVAAACLPPIAHAHEYWLAPSRYDGIPGAPVSIAAVAGTGFRGERKPWSPNHGVRFAVRATKVLDLSAAAAAGELEWVRFSPSDHGGALLAFESDFTPITLDPERFDRYLRDEGLNDALAVRLAASRRLGAAVPGRERYRRCAKAWLTGDIERRATVPFGLPFEIVPLVAPGSGSTLPIRVLAQGRPVAGVLVKAWRTRLEPSGMPTDPSARDSSVVCWRGTTDARGEAVLDVRTAGEWLVSAVTMVPSSDRAIADWESTWASLTFERR